MENVLKVTIKMIFGICQTVGDIGKCQPIVTFESVNLMITIYVSG